MVTTFGVWLGNIINNLATFLWPFVTAKTYDNLTSKLHQTSYNLHECEKHLDEVENYYEKSNGPILSYPDKMYRSNFSVDNLNAGMVHRYRFELEPIRNYYEINTKSYRDNPTEYVQQMLIRRVKEYWSKKAEIEELSYNGKQQIRSISKY